MLNLSEIESKKEEGIIGMLKVSLQLFLENLWPISLITLAMYLPINLILTLIPQETLTKQYGELIASQIVSGVTDVLDGLIGVIALMAIAVLIQIRVKGTKIGFKPAILHGFRRWHFAIITNIILFVFLIGLYLLLIIPGIIFSVFWKFALMAVALRKTWGWSALKYSKGLVNGRWFKTFGYIVLFGLLSFIVGTLFFFLSGLVSSEILRFLITVISYVVLAYFTVLTTVFFISWDASKK